MSQDFAQGNQIFMPRQGPLFLCEVVSYALCWAQNVRRTENDIGIEG